MSCLSFITELSDTDKASILRRTGGDAENIRNAYEMAKSQGGINSLTAWLIHITGKLQNGEISPPVSVNRQRLVNRFVNFTQREIDFAELERLEEELLRASMRGDAEAN